MRPPRLYKCTACNKIDTWKRGWSHFGSILIEEEFPHALIITCSIKCKREANANLESGKWKQPDVKIPRDEYLTTICTDHIGYQLQPNESELLSEYNQNNIASLKAP